MARTGRKNIDYFPHPVKHSRKMFYIEGKYGNNGYSTWFKLLEQVGDANYHYLDLKEGTQVMYLSSYCNISEDVLFDIIDDLVKLGEFHSDLWNQHKILFNQKFIESIQDAYKRRNNDCITLPGLYEFLGIKLPQKPSKKKSKNVVKKNIYRSFKHLSITHKEIDKLKLKYPIQQIDDILDDIENYKQNNKYTSLNLTANKWLKKEYKKATPEDQNNLMLNQNQYGDLLKKHFKKQPTDHFCMWFDKWQQHLIDIKSPYNIKYLPYALKLLESNQSSAIAQIKQNIERKTTKLEPFNSGSK